jgi:beta-glucosidase
MESFWHSAMYQPSSPLKAIRAIARDADIAYNDGSYPSAAADLARRSDVAIVFATKWTGETYDTPDLTLPDGQDELIRAVVAANPHTVVVLETGGPVLMPWLKGAGAVIEAWYPGIRGGEALADILFGAVNPSGHLPVTFPAAIEQLPNPKLFGQGLPAGTAFDVTYQEGADVGYRWYAAQARKPLFPFGHGLSYTMFDYGKLHLTGGRTLSARFTIRNDGRRAGSTVAQLFLTGGPNGPSQRLIGWSRVDLDPGRTRTVTVNADARLLGEWDETSHRWVVPAGTYSVALGRSAEDILATGRARLERRTLAP